jgi:AcrR family transcriptional regulator
MQERGQPAGAAIDGEQGMGSRRERILAAAIQEFARGGFQGTSTRRIAAAAGVTDPLLFYHFKSKAELYLAAVFDQLEKLRAGLDRALDGVDHPYEQLRVFVTVYLHYFLDVEPGLTVTLRELEGTPPAVSDAIAERHRGVVTARCDAILAEGVARGVFRPLDVPACTLAINGIMHIFIRTAWRYPERYSRARAIEQVLGYYAIGLLTSEAAAALDQPALAPVPAVR